MDAVERIDIAAIGAALGRAADAGPAIATDGIAETIRGAPSGPADPMVRRRTAPETGREGPGRAGQPSLDAL